MKNLLLLTTLTLLICLTLFAQRTITPTESISIGGTIKNPSTITIAQLDTFVKHKIPNQIIYNHKGEIKDTLTDMMGIPIINILASYQYIYEKPKELNEFYFVFSASDGYKVIFSWNEIYNTECGNSYYIVTDIENKHLNEIENWFLFIAAADLKPGRRYIKGLEKIEVKRIN